jgi:hypothetical protein
MQHVIEEKIEEREGRERRRKQLFGDFNDT